MNLCSGCGKNFTSMTAFDKHHPLNRIRKANKCLSTQEMMNKGFRLTKAGKWTYGAETRPFWKKGEE